MREVFKVLDISCQHCVMAINESLHSLTGVRDVVVDVKSKEVAVEYDEEHLSTEDVIRGIEEAGYRVSFG